MQLPRILLLLLIGYCGYWAIKQELCAYETGILQGFNHVPVVLLIFFTLLSIILLCRQNKRTTRSLYFFSVIIGFTLCSFIIYKLISYSVIRSSKTILTVTNMAGAKNVMTFEFKEGSKFRLVEKTLFGEVVCYGSYKMEKDSIKILKSNYGNGEKKLPQLGIIKSDTVFWENFETMLVEK